jgi:tripartite-type tricarboxylate transporter receptor subunit TctC
MRRQFLIWALVASATAGQAAWAAEARTDDYPVKPITVMVGYPAGGPTDALMRAIAPRLSAELHQPVLVDNRPGANEAIAAQLVSKAAPDGYTLLLSTETPLTQNQYLYRKLNYNPEKDFAPISRLISSPLALVVNANLPVNTLDEFIALARSRPPTKPVTYASGGTGSVLHLPMAMLATQNGLNMLHVPYKGVAPLLTDLIGGQVDSAWVAVAGAAPYVNDGRLKALVVDAPKRVKVLAQVPVLSETKVSPVQADFTFALQAPAGTPTPVIDKIAAAVRRILLDPDFRQKNIDPFGYVVVASTPAELAEYLAKDRPRQNERIKISGAILD